MASTCLDLCHWGRLVELRSSASSSPAGGRLGDQWNLIALKSKEDLHQLHDRHRESTWCCLGIGQAWSFSKSTTEPSKAFPSDFLLNAWSSSQIIGSMEKAPEDWWNMCPGINFMLFYASELYIREIFLQEPILSYFDLTFVKTCCFAFFWGQNSLFW